MTTTLRPRPTADALQFSPAFGPLVAATVAVAGVAAVLTPPTWLSVVVVIAVTAVLGIPHGAMDHLVVESIDGRHDQRSRRRFMTAYVLAMAAVALVWLVAPPLALALFFVLSVHHFGQSDLAYLRRGGPSRHVLQWSRGAFLVGLPLVAHLEAIAPTIERLGGVDPTTWSVVADRWWLWSALLVGQHVLVGAAVAPTISAHGVVERETITVAALSLLFLSADPLVGFAVYFGLWHSLAHLRVLTGLLGTQPSPVRSVVRLAAPLTAVSLLGLAAVCAAAVLLGRVDLLVPVVFVFVSMLTLPHMVVVERLWSDPGVRPTDAGAR